MSKSLLRVGQTVERVIDGKWFPAKITAVRDGGKLFDIVYFEDANAEEDVDREEIR